ncbi:MAG: thermonuclease family protein [Alphaproteobacteria bacterium]
MILNRIDENGIFFFENNQRAFLKNLWLQDRAVDYLVSNITPASELTLSYKNLKNDRYGNLAADIYFNGTWLQKELLEKGLAIFYDTSGDDEASLLLNFEKTARENRQGFWEDLSKIQKAESINPYFNDKALVIGKVDHIKTTKNNIFINFGKDFKKSFAVQTDTKIALPQLEGQMVLVRGFIQKYHSAFISLKSPFHIEIIDEKDWSLP